MRDQRQQVLPQAHLRLLHSLHLLVQDHVDDVPTFGASGVDSASIVTSAMLSLSNLNRWLGRRRRFYVNGINAVATVPQRERHGRCEPR